MKLNFWQTVGLFVIVEGVRPEITKRFMERS